MKNLIIRKKNLLGLAHSWSKYVLNTVSAYGYVYAVSKYLVGELTLS